MYLCMYVCMYVYLILHVCMSCVGTTKKCVPCVLLPTKWSFYNPQETWCRQTVDVEQMTSFIQNASTACGWLGSLNDFKCFLLRFSRDLQSIPTYTDPQVSFAVKGTSFDFFDLTGDGSGFLPLLLVCFLRLLAQAQESHGKRSAFSKRCTA